MLLESFPHDPSWGIRRVVSSGSISLVEIRLPSGLSRDREFPRYSRMMNPAVTGGGDQLQIVTPIRQQKDGGQNISAWLCMSPCSSDYIITPRSLLRTQTDRKSFAVCHTIQEEVQEFRVLCDHTKKVNSHQSPLQGKIRRNSKIE